MDKLTYFMQLRVFHKLMVERGNTAYAAFLQDESYTTLSEIMNENKFALLDEPFKEAVKEMVG